MEVLLSAIGHEEMSEMDCKEDEQSHGDGRSS